MSWQNAALVVVINIVLFFANSVECYATTDQLKQSADMMRTVCMTKTKPALEHVEGLGQGKFADTKEIKCYSNCVLELMQAMRKGKVIADSAIKQTELLIPPGYSEPTKKAFDACRNAASGIKNNCEAAYALLKCLQEKNPKFFFP